MAPKWGHTFDLLWSRDVIGHVTIRLPGPSFYAWFIVTMHPPGTVTEIWRLKDNGVTILTFWGTLGGRLFMGGP